MVQGGVGKLTGLGLEIHNKGRRSLHAIGRQSPFHPAASRYRRQGGGGGWIQGLERCQHCQQLAGVRLGGVSGGMEVQTDVSLFLYIDHW